MQINILGIDNQLPSIISNEEAQVINDLEVEFINSYHLNNGHLDDNSWLKRELVKHLPQESESECENYSEEILHTLKVLDEKQKSLADAVNKGRAKEGWFAADLQKSLANNSIQDQVKLIGTLDNAVQMANKELRETIFTSSGTVSQNPNLDGYIAEQYHAQTFNMNAEANGSGYRAEVLPLKGSDGKNGVDIVIKDKNGKIVRKYQSKYGSDSQATDKAFEKGDYRGQRRLVPKGQENGLSKKSSTVIEAPDGTTSNPLSKESAKEKQKKVQQSGEAESIELDYNEYSTKQVAKRIAQDAAKSAVLAAGIAVGSHIAQSLWNDEKIEGEKIIDTAVSTAIDSGVKAAAAGALTVVVRKGLISVIPKGTPVGIIATVANVGIENAKICAKVATGELTVLEGLNKMGEVTVSTVAGAIVGWKGAVAGAAIGTVLGPVGVVVGGFVGGTVGYIAGANVGKAVVNGVREVGSFVVDKITTGFKSVKNTAVSFFNNVLNYVTG
ncbi:MAG: hypothetical protein LBP22_12065 [Deltaproteobacteria bacterium]|nr:hypothetical protein [Deltaproteobacteria bacterium]